jgi:hypothetical protein
VLDDTDDERAQSDCDGDDEQDGTNDTINGP